MNARAGVLALALLWAAESRAEQYAYDAQGRVSEVTFDDGSKISYAYDLAGNIVRQADTAVAAIVEPPPPPMDSPGRCGCGAGGSSALALAALAALAARGALRARRRRGARLRL